MLPIGHDDGLMKDFCAWAHDCGHHFGLSPVLYLSPVLDLSLCKHHCRTWPTDGHLLLRVPCCMLKLEMNVPLKPNDLSATVCRAALACASWTNYPDRIVPSIVVNVIWFDWDAQGDLCWDIFVLHCILWYSWGTGNARLWKHRYHTS